MIKLFLFILFFILSPINISYSNDIVVINLEKLINDNIFYINIIDEIEKDQKKYKSEFNKEENNIKELSKQIERDRLILNEEEVNSLIENYNNKLSKLSARIERFNLHYQNEIINIRNQIFNEIITLLEKYVNDNNIKLVFDSNNYLIASNSIDITTIIHEKMNEINLKLGFENFEKN